MKGTEIILTMVCPFCGKEHEVHTTEEQYAEYCGGELAQNAFADLSATEREQIISHICPQCQEKIFG
jgi:wobble nucleotide-excising tRNase